MRRGLSFLVAAILLVLLVWIRVADPAPVRLARETWFDTLQRLSPRQYQALPVRVVDIDEASLAKFGQWPWPRDLLAKLVRQLTEMGASVIVFDVLFSEPDRMSPSRLLENPLVRHALGPGDWSSSLADLSTDKIFAGAMAKSRVVLGTADAGDAAKGAVQGLSGYARVGGAPDAGLFELPATTPIVGPLYAAAAGVGVVNVSPAALDGTVRDVPLIWRTGKGLLNTLSVEALRVALGESSVVLFGGGQGAGLQSLAVGDLEVPTSSRGTMRVYYRRNIENLFVSAADVLDQHQAAAMTQKIKGNIIFVGTSAAGLLDLHTTALGEKVPGVAIHAEVLEQILSGKFLQRSDATSGIEILMAVSLMMLITALLNFVGPAYAIGLGGVAATVVVAASWRAFSQDGLLLDVTYPVFAGFVMFSALAFVQYSVSDRERRAIRRSFSKYVSETVLGEIEKQGHDLKLGGELREVTVMFSDIRNFTTFSETLRPEDLVTLLNDLFSELTDDILGRSGTIDKYIGDSIMAFWNAPLKTPEHEAEAARAALAMRFTLARFNARRTRSGEAAIKMSIGLATGEACVGNVGSRERYNYSVIGDTVNVSARVENASRAVGYDLLLTDRCVRKCPGFATLPAGWLSLKGVSETVGISLLVGDEGLGQSQAFRDLKAAHDALLTELRAGGKEVARLAADCLVLAGRVEPGLGTFYDMVQQRSQDFRDRG